MKIFVTIIEIIKILLGYLDKKGKEKRYEDKKEKINESRENPEEFFENHFSGNTTTDDDSLLDDRKQDDR